MYMNASKIIAYVMCVGVLLAFCGPQQTECRHVIFKGPVRVKVVTGQILSSLAKDRPCDKCQMRDHRGNCRRLISFNASGVKC